MHPLVSILPNNLFNYGNETIRLITTTRLVDASKVLQSTNHGTPFKLCPLASYQLPPFLPIGFIHIAHSFSPVALMAYLIRILAYKEKCNLTLPHYFTLISLYFVSPLTRRRYIRNNQTLWGIQCISVHMHHYNMDLFLYQTQHSL